jgi:hypothetical protein
MSTNLIEAIQKKMGYPPLQKVDPVNHEVKNSSEFSDREKLAQAAIPAVLAIIYKFTRSEEGRNILLSGNKKGSWLDTMLEYKEKAAVDKVSQYAGVSRAEAEQEMEAIAVQAIEIIKESAGKKPTQEHIKILVGDQRHSILGHLPAAMQLGSLLDDDTLDDRTNKMEGPISSFMHTIEDKFSGGGA